MLRFYQANLFSEKGQKMKAKSGFTLVEILIVVVILGILAAVVIPQFTEASTEAKTSSLCTDLQTVRSQIELYKVQHNDNLPGTVTGVSLEQALTGYTNVAGVIQTGPGTNIYGPYMQKFPTNQFNDSAVVVTGTGTTPATAPGGGGWWYNTDTGEFKANDGETGHWAL
jgi:general secretion pathway protein G